MQISYTSSRQAQNQRFTILASIGIPLVAVFIQAYVPLYLPFFSILDVPLLVTIFFAVARRSPIAGTLTGALIGLLQDSLTQQQIGLFGIANTLIGYMASSIGVKLDVENPGSRFLMTTFFCVLNQAIYQAVAHGLANQTFQLRPAHVALAAVLNAILAVPLFSLLDRFKSN